VEIHALLNWILLISRADWGIPGYLCLRISKRVVALSSKSSLFSKLTAEPHGALASLLIIFRLQITTDASILLFKSTILCSDDKSTVESSCSGSKCSSVIPLYIASPRVFLPFYPRKCMIIKQNTTY